MDTMGLFYFVEAAKDLNFTKTAKRLFISQQNLSNHIARLENFYSVKLFERKPHLSLTYSGEVFLAYAKNFKMDHDNLINVLTNIAEREQGVLRIGCSPIRTNIVMPYITEIFVQKYPNIELQFFQAHSMELVEMLTTGELDFSISIAKDIPPSLTAARLFKDTIYLMTSRKLLEQYFGNKGVQELIDRAHEEFHLKEFERLPFVNVRSSKIFKDILNYSDCNPRFCVTTTYPLFSQHNLYENVAASLITKTIYYHIRSHVSNDICFFPIIKPLEMPLHDIAFIRHQRKYLSMPGQYFFDITIRYFDELCGS